ncbi:MAG TPA: copper chaperone PCu(A)C [Anaerolineales bacterium]|nr:copper chaperone PCu(A)C [Anaerolineales bacterium]
MNRIFVFMLMAAFLFGGCAAPMTEGVEVRDVWTRPAAQGANGAVYFVIRSSEADEIIGASSDVAEAVEIHESRMSGDVMEMHQVESVRLDAGDQVMFEPGGLHIMLIGLKQNINTGDEIEITLLFKNSQDLMISVPVSNTPGS